jgi:formamidopyrimidine-DNA glycosylase
MIELPEAITLARQINETLLGKEIAACLRGNTPHKFAFYTRSAEEYAAILPGHLFGIAYANGSQIRIPVGPDYILILGTGGEHILFHHEASSLPKKHHLLVEFTDSTYLSVTVQGWGCAMLLTDPEIESHAWVGRRDPTPLDETFTWDYFKTLLETRPASDPRSVKLFMTSQPGIWGVGNGCLQDILFNTRLHPRQRMRELTAEQERSLYTATRQTLQQMADCNGRDSERDLFNRPGDYPRLLDSKKVGTPCPRCASPIEKISYLGGACYFCPQCQVERKLG